MELFKDFDFKALEDPRYSEDSVRETIVKPILEKLGYQPDGKNKMLAGKSLTHPFVYIGTRQHKVSSVPDYLSQVKDTYLFTLDAKAPHADIRKGTHVEQAFSYAIHPEIRTFFYGLCNGKEICIYKWTKIEPVLTIPVAQLDKRWDELQQLVSPAALTISHLTDFLPDFGLSFLKTGAEKNSEFHFAGTWVNLVARVDDDTYTLTSVIGGEDDAYLGSFYFSAGQFEQFLSCIPERVREQVTTAVSEQPYFIVFTREDSFELIIHARFSGVIRTNEDEQYFPLTVINFAPVLDGKQITDGIPQ
jgi:hypothetical protein